MGLLHCIGLNLPGNILRPIIKVIILSFIKNPQGLALPETKTF